MPQVFDDYYPIPEYPFPICSWTKHSSTSLSVLPPTPAVYLLHGMSLGLMSSVSKNHLAMQLIDVPVS